MGLPGYKVICIRAGIRFGKSFAGAYEALKLIYNHQLQPNLGYLVAPTINMARTPKRHFQRAAGDAVVVEKRASDAGPAHFLMKPYSGLTDRQGNPVYYVVECHTGEHANRMRGESVAWAWVDEYQECRDEVKDVLLGRIMENNGLLILTGTASHAAHWSESEIVAQAYRCGKCGTSWYDHYELKRGEDGQPEKGWVWVERKGDYEWRETREYVPKDHEPCDPKGNPNYALIECSTFDNTQLPVESIEQLREEYALKDPVIARRELYGEPAGFEGVVYSAFTRKTHASSLTVQTVPPDSLAVAGIDFGVNDPFVCTFWAKVGCVWHGVAEYYYQGPARSLKEHAQAIGKVAGPLKRIIKRWWCDPSDPQQRIELSKNGLGTLSKAPRRGTGGKDWRNYRIGIINSLLLGSDEDGAPLLRINPKTCPNTIRDFETRRWKRYVSTGGDGQQRVRDGKGKQVDRNAGDEPAPGHDHGTDASEYALCSEYVKGTWKAFNRMKREYQRKERAPEQEPEEVNLGRHLALSMEEKRKRLLSGKPARKGRIFPGWAM